MRILEKCTLCHRMCGVNRINDEIGYCGQNAHINLARAALHFWEEPCISGSTGSGAVFFSGCSMRCVFCQNHSIADSSIGKPVSIQHLSEIFLNLQEQNASNINLITPTHFVPQIVEALLIAKENGLHIPIVYNTGSYETIETLQMLEGLIDIYLPDLKFYSPEISTKYANCPDYFDNAIASIAEMYRQVGRPVFSSMQSNIPDYYDTLSNTSLDTFTEASENQLMKKGVIVRHLLLPGHRLDSQKIISYLYKTYGNNIFISIMNQYTPIKDFPDHPELNRTVSKRQYEQLIDYAIRLGVENAFIQEGPTAKESFIPAFDYEGL